MKKVLLIIALLFIGMMASAQNDSKIIVIDKNFNKSCHCTFFSKSMKPKAEDMCDLIWELSQKVAGNSRLITLTMKDKEGHTKDYFSWHDANLLYLTSESTRMYIVDDGTFSHLRVIELEEDDWAVSVSSELNEEWMGNY